MGRWETDGESDREWFNIIMRVGETHSKNHRERLRDTVRERYHEWDRARVRESERERWKNGWNEGGPIFPFNFLHNIFLHT